MPLFCLSRGGSFYILYHLREFFEFQINKYVFDEIIDVLERKFTNQPQSKNKFFALISLTNIEIFANAPKKQVSSLERIISKEDAPILASALKHSNYLITLDNDFLAEKVLKFALSKNLIILKPKEFLIQFNYLR